MTKALIFDYGATIDSNGIHWAVIIKHGYLRSGIIIKEADFRDAYVHAERALAKTPYIKPDHNFFTLLKIKIGIELEYIIKENIEVQFNEENKVSVSETVLNEMIELNKESGINLPVEYLPYQYKIAEYCYLTAFESVGKAKSLLELLSKKYKLVLVSNFYGNIETVLKDFGILKLFPDIIESAVVGIRKPDPAIFALGVEKCMCTPEEVIVIGDSYKKDIIPAESLGCRTVWIKGEGWDNSEDGISHQQIITDFMELKEILL